MADHKRNNIHVSMTVPRELYNRIEKDRTTTEGSISRSQYICNKLQPTVPK